MSEVVYLKKALELQTQLLYKTVQMLGEELFPNNGPTILKLHNAIKDVLGDLHAVALKTAQEEEDSKNKVESSSQN